MKEVMVDLETMGTGSDAAIVSIGAVVFDFKTGEIGPQFFERVDLQSCIDAGLSLDGDTIMWWMSQDKEAQQHMEGNKLPLHLMLNEFTKWYKSNALGTNVWGNGATFDNVLLTNAYKACDMERPWKYWADMDVRTLVYLSGIKRPRTVAGVAHTPVDDCKHQINYCLKAWEKLHGTGS